jgi:hypothetical protein
MSRILFGGFAALVLTATGIATAPDAFAKPKVAFVKMTAAQFISSCEQMGGRATRTGEGTIRCTLPSGTVVDCSFVAGQDTMCTWDGRQLAESDRQRLIGDPLPGSINPNASKPANATGGTGVPSTVN